MKRRLSNDKRRGSIFVCVLVCVAVASTLAVATVSSALRAHKEVRTQRYLRQTEFLLEAAIQRAAQRLAADEEYTGETMDLSPATIPGCTSAQLEIKIPSLDDGAWPRRVEVIARLGHGGPSIIQRSYAYPLDDLAQTGQE